MYLRRLTMGTRGIYIFEDAHDEVAVYKHWDNYPRGAARFIEEAKAHAWKLPRFEPDEFGAAFVAANKCQEGGGIRLIPPYKDRQELMEEMSFCDYCYVVGFTDRLMVTIYTRVNCAVFGSRWIEGESEALDDMLSREREIEESDDDE
jgi:hypothetical protein